MQEFIINVVQKTLDEKAQTKSFNIETNLIYEGILDSLEFINLLMEIEGEFDLDIDFSDLDPSEFTTIKGLVANLT